MTFDIGDLLIARIHGTILLIVGKHIDGLEPIRYDIEVTPSISKNIKKFNWDHSALIRYYENGDCIHYPVVK